MKINKIKGLIAAPFTPMKGDGTINPGLIPGYARKLKAEGVKGVFICGTTGEGMLMTNEERKIVAESWISEQKDDFKVIVHTGTTSARQSHELAAHAAMKGAYATGCMGPVFLKPSGADELVAFCAEAASGAPDIPFYYYHIPSVSGVQVSMPEFIKKASLLIPNFTGIKFTNNNFMEMKQCLDLDNGRWDILHGFDEILVAGLFYGARGAVGSTYNFMAPLYNSIITDFSEGKYEEAKEKQALSIKVVEVLLRYNGAIVAGKALMKHVGIDCGPCRIPLKNLTAKEYDNFVREMEATGIFEKFARRKT